ncbi:MAG: AI-2E family transporter [Gammaproteobacteria bacterium]|nr:AI-2E family transporter [Gammaproteobacteria bacterium]
MPKQSQPDAALPLIRFGLGLMVIAGLYLGQDVLIPIALAVLLSFVLAPAADRLERWRLPPVPSVIATVIFAFSILGLVGLMVSNQVVSLAESLPKYQDNITQRFLSLQGGEGGVFERAAETFFAIREDIRKKPSAAEPDVAEPQGARGLQGDEPLTDQSRAPVLVEMLEESPSTFELLRDYVSPALIPLARLGLAVVLVIFFLLQREDLRDRLIRLMSRDRLDVTTRALNDAGDRIGRYLRTQLLINTCYGVPIAIGLAIIGLPGALLWGLLGMLLRFIPYVGPWLAASMPILLSLAVFDGWILPAAVVALFIVLESFTNMVMEPWLYGASTGLSPVAVLLAVIFWSSLWGGVGLLLAIPLTVCLVVAGRHLPQFEFFTILLGKEPALSATERFYQRLLAGDHEGAMQLAREHSGDGLMSVYDQVIIPALALAERDRHDGHLEPELEQSIIESASEIVDALGTQDSIAANGRAIEPHHQAFELMCLPSRDLADELTARMFAQVLKVQGIGAQHLSIKSLASEMVKRVGESEQPVVCVSALPPKALAHTRYLCKRLKQQFPKARVAVGVWNNPVYAARVAPRLNEAGADAVLANLAAGVKWARQRMNERVAVIDRNT